MDGYDWSTYLKLKEDSILGLKAKSDWSEGDYHKSLCSYLVEP